MKTVDKYQKIKHSIIHAEKGDIIKNPNITDDENATYLMVIDRCRNTLLRRTFVTLLCSENFTTHVDDTRHKIELEVEFLKS